MSALSRRILEVWGLALRWAAGRPGLLRQHGLPEPEAAWRQLVLEGRASAIGGGRVWDLPLEALVGVLPVATPGRGGLFDLAEDGAPAVIQPVTAHGLASPAAVLGLVDLVAWRPAEPECWWLLTGAAQWLGPADADAWLLGGEEAPALRLVSTPLDWMRRQEAAGWALPAVCVLDWSVDTVARLLPFGGQDVVCDDVGLGERVQRLLAKARLPQIGIELQEAA